MVIVLMILSFRYDYLRTQAKVARNMSSQVLTTQTSVSVFSRLLRAHSSLSRELCARLVTEHGLTINDYEALLHLSHAEEGSMRRVDLAERLMLTPSGVTRLLDGLERDGWVRRATATATLASPTRC